MVLNLRKRPWKYLGDDSDDDDDSEPRRVKRELSTSSSLGAVALSEEQPRVQLKPPWYHIDELAFHTAETRPHYTPAFIVNFLKANAVSVAYHRTTGRTAAYHKKYLTLSLPDGRSAMVSAEYRLPVIYLSHFLWSYVWRVIALGDPFEAEMFNLLHLARLLCALAQGAIRAAPQYKLADGGDICAWRCQPFDRALLRMSYDDFLLPIDGYGERYHQAFWKRHQDTKYRPRQEIEHRNWRKVVSSRNGWLAPLRVNDALTPFDAAAVADCLHMGPGGPFWEPTTEAGHAVTKRLHDQYPDVIGGTVHSIAFTKEAPIGVATTAGSSPAMTTVISEPAAPAAVPVSCGTPQTSAYAPSSHEGGAPKAPLPRRKRPSGVCAPEQRQPNCVPSVTAPQQSLLTSNTSWDSATQIALPESATPTQTAPMVVREQQGTIPPQASSPPAATTSAPSTPQPPSRARGPASSRIAELEKDVTQLRATIAAHAEYRALSDKVAEDARQREARLTEEVSRLRHEATEREDRYKQYQDGFAQERLAARQRETQWQAQRKELEKNVRDKLGALERADARVVELQFENAALRGQVDVLQTRLSNAAQSLGVDAGESAIGCCIL